MRQPLMTEELKKLLPALYEQEGKGFEAIAYAKFFHAYGAGEWFATEFDGEDVCFGWAQNVGGYPDGEFGYFSISELQSVDARINGCTIPGLKAIERDRQFKPARLCDIAEIGLG